MKIFSLGLGLLFSFLANATDSNCKGIQHLEADLKIDNISRVLAQSVSDHDGVVTDLDLLCLESENGAIVFAEDLRKNDYIKFMATYMGIDHKDKDILTKIKKYIIDNERAGTPICPGDDEYNEVVEEWWITRAFHVVNVDSIRMLFHPEYLGLPITLKDRKGNDIAMIIDDLIKNDKDLDDMIKDFLLDIQKCVNKVKETNDPYVWKTSICSFDF